MPYVCNESKTKNMDTNFNYIVWVGGIPNYFKQKIDAEINGNYWKDKGYADIIIEKI